MKKMTKLGGKDEEILQLYSSGLSTIKIGAIFGCHPSTCERLLKKHGIILRRKKYTVDDDYFNTIDSPEKAYWLGMMATDGNINKKFDVCSISLIDYGHLEKLKACLNSDYPIYNNNKIYTLQITSKQIKKSLINIGLIPNKSKTLSPPKLEKHEEDFWRGCIDGDGGISKRGKYWSMHFCGSKQMVAGLRDYIHKHTKHSINISTVNKYFCRLQLRKFSVLQKIMNIMYYKDCISLDRKYNLAQNIINNITCIDNEYLYNKKKDG